MKNEEEQSDKVLPFVILVKLVQFSFVHVSGNWRVSRVRGGGGLEFVFIWVGERERERALKILCN